MPEFTIVKAERKREFTGKHGPMVSWAVELADGQTVELVQKPTTPEPSGTVEGTIEETDYGPKLKKAPPAANGFRGGGKSPKETAEIVRMNSHRHALSYLAYKHAATGENTVNSWSEYVRLVQAFYDDIRGVEA